MGQEINAKTFTDADVAAFHRQLRKETTQLAELFSHGGFSEARQVGGFELEAWLVGEAAAPVPRNADFLAAVASADVVPELSQFNFELNVEPRTLGGRCLAQFEEDLARTWQLCRDKAGELGLDVMMVGIHPQLKDSQLVLRHISAGRRYRALNERILKLRNRMPIVLDIQGREHLHTEHMDVMLEAATTSFQIHLQLPQGQSVRAYNAAQIVSAPLLAVGANSPYLFGVDLWDETRVPLFEQAVNIGQPPQRVTLGETYVHESLLECFEQNLRDYPVLIPACSDEPSESFPYLRLHNGTIWRWNRPLLGFDASGQPHLRVENRVLPAGPTVVDMLANAALFWGAVETMSRAREPAEHRLPFEKVKTNFYGAVRQSLDCQVQWLNGRTYDCASLVREELLPMASEGLAALGVATQDAQRLLGVIEDRVRSRQNGAHWQRRWVAKHGRDMEGLSCTYLQNQHRGQPVHLWEI